MIIEKFFKNELQRENQTEFRVEKVIKRKCDKLYVKWESYNNSLKSWIDKKDTLYKLSYFPEPHTYSKSKMEVQLASSNYATKSDLKNTPGVDTPEFAEKLI